MLKNAGLDLAQVEADIDKELKPHSAELKGWTASLEVKTRRGKMPLRNVIGVLEGKGPLANETVVVGAHYDHLGYGGSGTGSLARSQEDGDPPRRRRQRLRHHLAPGAGPPLRRHSPIGEAGEGRRTGVHDLQRRGAGPARLGLLRQEPALSAQGHGLHVQPRHGRPAAPRQGPQARPSAGVGGRHAPGDFEKLRGRRHAQARPRPAIKSDAFFDASDHYSFYRKGVPVLFFWTGMHADYHRPTDTADKINVPGHAPHRRPERGDADPFRHEQGAARVSGAEANEHAGAPAATVRASASSPSSAPRTAWAWARFSTTRRRRRPG